jgi:hypothetical protein
MEMNSWARCLLHGRNKSYLSRNRSSNNNTQHNTQRWRYTQSEPSKRETFFNQQPANLQAEVRSYVLYNDNKYLYRRLTLVVSSPSTRATSEIDTTPTLVTPTKEIYHKYLALTQIKLQDSAIAKSEIWTSLPYIWQCIDRHSLILTHQHYLRDPEISAV